MRRHIRQQKGWLSFFVGLALGLFVAVLVYLQGVGPQGGPTLGVSGGQPTGAPVTTVSPSPSPAPSVTKSPQFDFYTILPESEVKVFEGDSAIAERKPLPSGQKPLAATVAPPAADTGKTSAESAGGKGGNAGFALQVGSFQRLEDADKSKARLALLGVTADIVPVLVNGNETWFRVMVGPFADVAKLQNARSRLVENQIKFIIVRSRVDANRR